MVKTVVYDSPHALFHQSFIDHIIEYAHGRRTVIVTANAQHAKMLVQTFTDLQASHMTAMTLQAFLIRQLQHQRPRKVINATSRAVLVQQAWQRADGPLWRQYGNHRGALREIGQMLSWISNHRTHWANVHADIDVNHEIGATYANYVDLLHTHGVVGYDDVALHVSDEPLPALEYELIVGCELHFAQPSQCAVLSKYAHTHDMWLGAWISHQDVLPEQHALLHWLSSHAHPVPLIGPSNHGSQLSRRLLHGTAEPLPPFSVVGTRTHNSTHPWRAGASTVVDECHAIAHHCHHLLKQGRSVHVVCADEQLVQHVRAAIVQYGIELPPLAPPDYMNPIINLARLALRWMESVDADAQQHIIYNVLTLPFVGVAPVAARHASADPDDATHHTVRSWLNALEPTQALAPQLRHLLNQSGAMMWAWQTSNHSIDVRDNWLRETRSWLERIDEIDQLAQQQQLSSYQREQLLLGVDALPAPMRELYRSTLPITISASSGAHAATDSVIIMGLSEHVAPRSVVGFQLIPEDTLCAVFTPAHRPGLPQLTAPAAWHARELRRFSSMIASHATNVILSFSHYGANGQAQLATPFFAELFAGSAEFDRDGHVIIHDTSIACVPTLPIPQAVPTTTPPSEAIQLLTNNTFSASQISTYLNCPRRYYYEKVIQLGHDDDTEIDERNLHFGTLAHEILCAVLGTGAVENVDLRNETFDIFKSRMTVMPQRVHAALHGAWQGQEVQLPGGGVYRPSCAWHERFGTGLRLRSNWLRMNGMLQRWWEYECALYERQPQRRPVLLEHQLDFDLNGMRILGRVDRVDMIHLGTTVRYEIIDYKSSKPKDYSELLNGFVRRADKPLSNFQIPIYLLGTSQPSWHLTPAADTLTLFYLGQNSKNNGQLRTISVTDTATDIRKSGKMHVGIDLNKDALHGSIQRDLIALMQQMRIAPYPTQPSRQCGYCQFMHICDDAQ